MLPTIGAVLPGWLWGLRLPAQEVAQGGSPAAQGVIWRHEPVNKHRGATAEPTETHPGTCMGSRPKPARARIAAPGLVLAWAPRAGLLLPPRGAGGVAFENRTPGGAEHGSQESHRRPLGEHLQQRQNQLATPFRRQAPGFTQVLLHERSGGSGTCIVTTPQVVFTRYNGSIFALGLPWALV